VRDRAASQLARGDDARRGRVAETGLAQACRVGLRERAKAAERAKRFVREDQRGARAGAAADQEREELVVGERGRAAREQTLAGTRRLRPFADRYA